jgi:sarcosine oxidase subunit beta
MSRVVSDVVIIGAGILGCSTAFYLAKRRNVRVIVVEKGSLASGMTKRSGALVHAHFSDATQARLAHASIKQFQNWQDIVGASCAYTQTGLVVVADQAHAQRLANETAKKISPADVRELEPRVNVDDVASAVFEPEAGYLDPILATQTIAARAKDLGVTFKTGVLVKNIHVNLGRVSSLETTTGDIETSAIIVMAGAWSDRLLKPLGIQIDLQLARTAVAFFDRPVELKATHPAFIDYATGAHFRPHTYGLTMVGLNDADGEGNNPDAFDENVASEVVNDLRQRLATRMPGMANARYVRGHAGIYDFTPNHRPVISRVPEIGGLFIAAGFGAHGFCFAPAIGAGMAELVTDGEARTVDLKYFAL